MMRCQSCGHQPLSKILSLGHLPACNDMQAIGSAPMAHTWLPTDLMHCEQCDLVQLGFTAPPGVVFPPSYPYTSGSTKILRDNFADLYKNTRQLVDLKPDDLVIDIGSNDGTLLSNFQRHRVLGIEPTDVADIANARGIRTVKSFFGANVAHDLRMDYGQKAKVITCANCFAHMDDVHGVIEGVLELLAPDGLFVSESHYLIALLERLQYDTIYHEHLRYYSLASLRHLLQQHGLHVFFAKAIPTHGGSIRVFARRSGPGEAIDIHLSREPTGDKLLAKLMQFAGDVTLAKLRLLSKLHDIKLRGERVVGISAPSRAATVVNYCRLDSGIVDYVCEVEGSLKIGKCMPGTDIPVVDEARLFRDQPEHAILFSWHIADELIPKLRAKGYRGTFIMPCEREEDYAAQAEVA